jgi:hypothetical protein
LIVENRDPFFSFSGGKQDQEIQDSVGACGHVFESLCKHTHTPGKSPQAATSSPPPFHLRLQTGDGPPPSVRRLQFYGLLFPTIDAQGALPPPVFSKNTLPILEKARAHSCASHVFRSVRIRVLRAGEQVVLRSSAELATRRSWWPKWPLPYELGQADILSISYRIILILVRNPP